MAGLLLALAAAAPEADAQRQGEQTPNLGGAWAGASGTLHFNFIHRFTASPAPARKISASPTFLIAAGLPRRTLIGAHYATNSRVVPGMPNEWEAFVRHTVLEGAGAPLDVTVQAGYNATALSADGELAVGRGFGRVRLMGTARAFSNAFDNGDTRVAFGGGASLMLGRWLAVGGDGGSLIDRRAGEKPFWSAVLDIQIPYTPHLLSLQAGNTVTRTLQGSSAGVSRTTYGFSFTIPVTLRRYFGGGRGSARTGDDAAGAPPAAVVTDTSRLVRADIRQLAFQPARIEIQRGTTIEWTNSDPLVHTVTADDESWDSGDIEPGATWRRTFDEPGTYPFHCTPHPFMRGEVVVR